MKVIKRNGSEVDFDIDKIQAAVTKANKAAVRQELTAEQIQEIAEYINFKCNRIGETPASLDACPIDSGRYCFSFCLASVRRLGTAS